MVSAPSISIMSIPKPTESSPLLPESSTVARVRQTSPNGILPDSNSHVKAVPEEDNEERIDAQSERAPHYEGLPEVRKQLKYIVPAIAIGVSPCDKQNFFREEMLTSTRYFFLLATRQSLCRATAELGAS